MRIFILTSQLYHINVNSCLGILFQVFIFLPSGLRIMHIRYVTCFRPCAPRLLSTLIISILKVISSDLKKKLIKVCKCRFLHFSTTFKKIQLLIFFLELKLLNLTCLTRPLHGPTKIIWAYSVHPYRQFLVHPYRQYSVQLYRQYSVHQYRQYSVHPYRQYLVCTRIDSIWYTHIDSIRYTRIDSIWYAPVSTVFGTPVSTVFGTPVSTVFGTPVSTVIE